MITIDISRRDAIRLAGGGLAAALSAPLLAGCGLTGGVAGPRFLPRMRIPTKLLVVETAGMTPDDLALLCSLQGLVNRSGRGPSLYLVQRNFDTGWLGTALAHIPQETVSTANLQQFLAGFASAYKGAVVWDPSQTSRENGLPYTKNVAATYAGLHDLLLATRSQASALGLDVQLDLTGKFTDEDAAYAWALKNLWPACSREFVVSEEPVVGGYLYDFAVASRAFCFTFNPFRATQKAMAEQLYKGMVPNGILLGWWSNGSSGQYEWSSVQITSPNSVAVVAANFFTNATVWGGVSAPVAAPSKLNATAEAKRLLAAGKKVFMSLQVSDGDNAAADESTIFDRWQETSRGKVPISWSLDPILADMAPAILAYFRRTATPNDAFSTGPSGAGYMYANMWPAAQLPAYTSRTAQTMRAAGIPIPWVWPNPAGPATLSDTVLAEYVKQIQPRGMFLGSGSSPRIQWVGDTPCIWLSGGTNPTFPPPTGGYMFGAHEIVLWNNTTKQIADLGLSLEATGGTTLVLPEVLFELMRLTRSGSTGA